MNKKQRNKKDRLQNERNRLINRRYLSTMRTLSKIFYIKLARLIAKHDNFVYFISLVSTFDQLCSILDKSVKKNILHKNTAARKKSIFAKLIK